MKTFKEFQDEGRHLSPKDKHEIINNWAAKEYARQWLDEAAEVAMKQCENGLPVGDAIYELKNLIDKQ